MSVVGPDDGYDLALMAGRRLTSLAAVVVATVAGLTLMSNAAASVPQSGGARSGTSVVLDPATGAVLRIGASHLRPAMGGALVVLDPATGAVLRRIGASHLRPARGGTVVELNPATGAILRIR
jgi:hypothetical protein